MALSPIWRRRVSWPTALSLLALYGCCTSPGPAQRPQLPQEVNQEPPPVGAFLACQRAIEEGQIPSPACDTLPKLAR